MERKITFYEDAKECNMEDLLIDRESTQKSIQLKNTDIHTTDLSSLSSLLWDYDYKIFVKHRGQRLIEVKIGNNDWTRKEIRYAHNLFRLFISGAMEPEN